MRALVSFLFLILFFPACKRDTPRTVLPIKFERGMPLDSAKKLVESAGWLRDTELLFQDSFLELRFKNLRFQNARDSFNANLLFINNRMFHAQLHAEPLMNLGTGFVPKKVHSLQEYYELVQVIETVYGTPRNQRTFIERIQNIPDTEYITDWDTIENGRPETIVVMLNLNGLWFNAI